MRLLHGMDISKFRSMLAQSMLAFSFNLGGLVAGLVLSLTFQSLNSILILLMFPAILTVRGDINGILSGKLGTALHTGRMLPSLRNNTNDFYSLIRSTFVLTFIEMSAAGYITFLFSTIFLKASVKDVYFFVMLPPLTGCISMILSIPFTSMLSFLTFKKGLDPDVIVYPITSTVNDITITFIYFGVAWTLLQGGNMPRIFSNFILLIIILICLNFVVQQRKDKVFTNMLKEGAPVVLFCAILGSIGGLMLGGIKKFIEQKPGTLIIYPALIGNLGAVGSIIGSTTTSRLHLGRITPQVSSLKNAASEITAIEVSSIFMHMAFGLIAFIFTSKIFLKNQLNVAILPSISILSNLISFIPICLLSFMIAILTFRKGLDPDNFVIPLETSISDVLATFSLYTVILVIYHIIG